MNYREVYNKIKNDTENFTLDSGYINVSSKSELSAAIDILSKVYSDVKNDGLDYSNKDVNGLNYKVKFSNRSSVNESLNKATAYMLKKDGSLIECDLDHGNYHPYVLQVYGDVEDDIKSFVIERSDELKWIYDNTDNDHVKEYIRIIYKSILNTNNDYLGVDDSTYTAEGNELKSFAVILNNEVNNEFCRVRTSNIKYGGNSNDIYFRISSIGFNWFPVIWKLVMDNKDISSVTISRDNDARDYSQGECYRVNGVEINHMPRNEFLTLKGNPIIERYNFKSNSLNKALHKLTEGYSLTDAIPDVHPRYLNSFYKTIENNQLKNDMNIKVGDTYMKESINNLNEAIEKHDTLNPDLWDENNELHPEVKDKLEEIVDKFQDNLKDNDIDLDITDICIIGSNASYNYNDASDVDLHIIADTSIYDDEDLALKIYLAYKALFNNKYDPTIRGHEVEVYVEPYEVHANSKGIYSLFNGWLKEPENVDIPEIDQVVVDDYLAPFIERYDDVMKSGTVEDVNKLIDDIYLERQKSIMKDGEFAIPNLAFKEFRTNGYLQNLRDRKVELENQAMSLDDNVNSNLESLFIEEEFNTLNESVLPSDLKVGDVFKGNNSVIEILEVNDDSILYRFNDHKHPYEALDPIESFLYMINDFNFKKINEEAEAKGNGFMFRFPEVEDTLHVFLQWEGILGYDSDILDYQDTTREDLASFLEDEGIYGYTYTIWDILKGEKAFCSGMDISDFEDICNESGLDPADAEMFDGETIVEELPNDKSFNLGDKVKIEYISDANPHNGVVGKITWLNKLPNGECQAEIAYPDGTTSIVDNIYRKGSGVVSPIEKVNESYVVYTDDYFENGKRAYVADIGRGITSNGAIYRDEAKVFNSEKEAQDWIDVMYSEYDENPELERFTYGIEKIDESVDGVLSIEDIKDEFKKMIDKHPEWTKEKAISFAGDVLRDKGVSYKDLLIAKEEFESNLDEDLDEDDKLLINNGPFKYNEWYVLVKLEPTKYLKNHGIKDLYSVEEVVESEDDDPNPNNGILYTWGRDSHDLERYYRGHTKDYRFSRLCEHNSDGSDIVEMSKDKDYLINKANDLNTAQLNTNESLIEDIDDDNEIFVYSLGGIDLEDRESLNHDIEVLGHYDLHLVGISDNGDYTGQMYIQGSRDDIEQYLGDYIGVVLNRDYLVPEEDFSSTNSYDYLQSHKFNFKEDLAEAKKDKVYKVVKYDSRGREYFFEGTLDELITKFSYTLEKGKSWERERGNHKINMNPKNINSLIDNLNWAVDNAAANGYSDTFYELVENEDLREGCTRFSKKFDNIKDARRFARFLDQDLDPRVEQYDTEKDGEIKNWYEVTWFDPVEWSEIYDVDMEEAYAVKVMNTENNEEKPIEIDRVDDGDLAERIAKGVDGAWVEKVDEAKYLGSIDDKDQKEQSKKDGVNKDTSSKFDIKADEDKLNEAVDEDDERAIALANYLGVNLDEIDNEYEDHVYTVNNAEEYFVLTKDEAYNQAAKEIENLIYIDSFKDMFSPRFKEYVYNNCINQDEVDSFIESEIEYFRDQEEDENMVTYLEELSDSDRLQYVKDTLGPDTFEDWAEDKLNLDEVAEEAIRQDGVEHFLSSDNVEIDLGDGLYAYNV